MGRKSCISPGLSGQIPLASFWVEAPGGAYGLPVSLLADDPERLREETYPRCQIKRTDHGV